MFGGELPVVTDVDESDDDEDSEEIPKKCLETYSQEITTEDLLQLVKVSRYK